jgi:hypothetical protein
MRRNGPSKMPRDLTPEEVIRRRTLSQFGMLWATDAHIADFRSTAEEKLII